MRDRARQLWLFFGNQTDVQGMMVREAAPEQHVHPAPDGSFAIKGLAYIFVVGRDEDTRRVKGA